MKVTALANNHPYIFLALRKGNFMRMDSTSRLPGLLLNKEQLNQDNTPGAKGHHPDLRALNVRMKLTGVKDIYVT